MTMRTIKDCLEMARLWYWNNIYFQDDRGIADAFLVSKNFISNSEVMMVLGDNIFYGQNFQASLH